jgi:hypothetical protein
MRPSTLRDAVVLALLLPTGVVVMAADQQAADPLDACYQLQDTTMRVACYDQEVQRRHAAAAQQRHPVVAVAPAAAPVSAAPAATTQTAPASQAAIDDTIGLDGKQLDIKRKQEGIQPVAIKPIVAALARLQPRPGHQYDFELDNGQVWESTDTEPDLFLDPHETVTIRPGILGAFFLKTQEGNSIRVHRLR